MPKTNQRAAFYLLFVSPRSRIEDAIALLIGAGEPSFVRSPGKLGPWKMQTSEGAPMLYKVTPMLPETPSASKPPKNGRVRRRNAAIFDSEGHEVLITLICLKCHKIKPLVQFGLRKMPDGAIRNQPWCRPCRGGAAVGPGKTDRVENLAQHREGEQSGASSLEVGPSNTSAS
jgi:hypothetical protein